MKPEFVEVALNPRNPYATDIFCPVNRMMLNKINPIGRIYVLTDLLLLELSGSFPTLVDLNNMIDIENKCFKDIPDEMQEELNEGNADNLPITNTVDYSVIAQEPVVETQITEEPVNEVQTTEETVVEQPVVKEATKPTKSRSKSK